jgi:hypothetical protein
VTAEERIARIERAVEQLLADVSDLPDEALYREPDDGEWTIMSTLAHVTEILPYWAHQAEAINRAPGQPFGRPLDDPGRVGPIATHGNDSLEAATGAIRASADECIRTLRALPADGWTKSGMHPTRGPMTVEELVDSFLAGHVEAHVRQVNEALDALSANPSG